MDTNIVICLMIGLPGAGKTTLSQKLTSDLFPQFEIKVLTFSFDDFLPLEEQEKLVISTQDNVEYRLFKDTRNKFVEEVESTVRNLMTLGTSDLRKSLKYLIIVDDNFYYKSMRYRFFQMASKYNCGFCQVYLACDVDAALERNHSRSKRVCEEVIRNMSDRMEPPNQTNSWEKQSITFHLLDEKLSGICSLIATNYSQGLSILNLTSIQKATSQAINLQSLIHRADLILRALVAESVKMSMAQGSSKKEVALRVNIIRQNLLSNLRDKKLQIPITVLEEDIINVEELSQFLRNEFENCLK